MFRVPTVVISDTGKYRVRDPSVADPTKIQNLGLAVSTLAGVIRTISSYEEPRG